VSSLLAQSLVWRRLSPSYIADITQAILSVLSYDHRLSIVHDTLIQPRLLPANVPLEVVYCPRLFSRMSPRFIPHHSIPSVAISYHLIQTTYTALWHPVIQSIGWLCYAARVAASALLHVDILNGPLYLAKRFPFIQRSLNIWAYF
jgi:hypothetical protein